MNLKILSRSSDPISVMGFHLRAWDALYQTVVGGDADMEGNGICLHIPFSPPTSRYSVKESDCSERSCQKWLFHAAVDKLIFNSFPCLLKGFIMETNKCNIWKYM